MVLDLVIAVKTGPMAARAAEKQDVNLGTDEASDLLRATLVLKFDLLRFPGIADDFSCSRGRTFLRRGFEKLRFRNVGKLNSATFGRRTGGSRSSIMQPS